MCLPCLSYRLSNAINIGHVFRRVNIIHGNYLFFQTLGKFIKKETRPILVMFYAPWCGFCKTLKPEFSAAATELKPKYILSAIDVNRPENSIIRKQYNITGFPTLLYFE